MKIPTRSPVKARLSLRWATLTAALALSGCATQGPKDDAVTAFIREKTENRPVLTDSAARTAAAAMPEEIERNAPIIYRGTDVTLAQPKGIRAVEQRGEMVTLDFADAPIGEVVQALLGDLLKVSFAIEQMPQGTVSLRTGGPVSRDSVLPIVESMLQSNGAALVRDREGIYRITSLDSVKQFATSLHRPNALPLGYGLVVVPLRYAGAAQMAEILQPVAPDGSIVRVDTTRNLLILAGTRTQHEGWLEIVRSFDIDYLKGMSLGIFPLEYGDVDEIYDTLSGMLGGARNSGSSLSAAAPQTGGSGGAGGLGGGAGGSAGNSSAQEVSIGAAIRMFPLKRLNSIVAVSPRAEHLETLREWILRLDQPALNDLEPRLYVYSVQNGSATHLAGLLSSLYGGSGSSGRRQSDSGVAPGLSASSLTGSSSTTTTTTSTSTAGGMGSTASLPDSDQSSNNLTSTVGLADNVKVVADERNNALLIRAPRKDYRRIESALRRLDVAPTQVLIEASIIEVALTGQLKYGLEWTFSGRLGGGRTGTGLLNLNNEGNIGPSQPGFSYTITGAGGDISAVLNALAQNSLVKVLSSPSLLVQDNHTASIHVGDQRPVQMGTTVNSNTTIENIEYRDLGVMLSVTPSANAGGLVSMTIHQTVSDLGTRDEATGQYTFTQRQVKSRVSVRSGETVVMGGLISERASDGRAGLPLLHDIPVLGNLFGSTSEQTSRTELLVMITPRVISSEGDLRAVGDELRDRMRGMKVRTIGPSLGLEEENPPQ